MTVALDPGSPPRTFNVEIARQTTLLPTLVFTALTNSVDMEGDLPEEMTADLQARIEVEGREPIVIKDTFSGFSGSRAPQALYSQVGAVVNILIVQFFQAGAHRTHRVRHASAAGPAHGGDRSGRAGLGHLRAGRDGQGHGVSAAVQGHAASACRCR